MIVLATLIIFSILLIISIILISRWVYLDAKYNGLNPVPWVFATILIPNFIGLIIYAALRPKKTIICENCKAHIDVSSKYCSNCGNMITSYQNPEAAPKKRLLIGGFSLMVLTIVLLTASLITMSLTNTDLPIDNLVKTYTFGSYENNFGNSWTMSFNTFQGTKRKTFTAKSDSPVLVYSSEITKGTISFNIYDSEKNLIVTIPQDESGEFKDLKSGEKYTLIITSEKAGGKFSFKME